MSKILFVLMRDFSIGGSLTSMLNLLKLISKRKLNIEIDLLMMHNGGTLYSEDIDYVNLLPEEKRIGAIMLNPETLIKEKRFDDIVFRSFFCIKKKLKGEEVCIDKLLEKEAIKYTGYDTVIAFQEGLSTKFAQYISAKRKIAWVHNNLERISSADKFDQLEVVYGRFDKIIGVSNAVINSFKNQYPQYRHKYQMIYNTIDVNAIYNKAYDTIDDIPQNNGIVFVSVGRFAEQKKFDRIPEIARKLKDDGHKFLWIVIGGGQLFDKVQKKCIDECVDDCVYLMGTKRNPYPYINAAGFMVLTSLYEAHPMVAIEGLILHKPVITTNYPSAHEVVTDGYDGLICENSAEAIYKKLSMLLEDKSLQKNLKANAERFAYDNDSIVSTVTSLWEN